MSGIPIRPVYGERKPVFGQTSFGIWFSSVEQAQLMKGILEEAMKNFASMPEETLLARWYNEIAHQLRASDTEGWAGWEKEENNG